MNSTIIQKTPKEMKNFLVLVIVAMAGIGPATARLWSVCSTTELHSQLALILPFVHSLGVQRVNRESTPSGSLQTLRKFDYVRSLYDVLTKQGDLLVFATLPLRD